MKSKTSSFAKLLSNLFITMKSMSKEQRLREVQNFYYDFSICSGCELLVEIGYDICPYCKSYNFIPIDKKFADSLNKDSKYIDYDYFLE